MARKRRARSGRRDRLRGAGRGARQARDLDSRRATLIRGARSRDRRATVSPSAVREAARRGDLPYRCGARGAASPEGVKMTRRDEPGLDTRPDYLLPVQEPPETLGVIPPYMLETAPPHPFQRYLADVERMAAQGLELHQIAARLGFSEMVFADAAVRFRDLAAALTGGRARLWDQVSARLFRNAMAGDTSALTFLAKTKAGFAAPTVLQVETKPSEPKPAPITLDHVDGMAARQIELMARRAP